MTAVVAGNVRTTYLWKPEGTALLLLDNNERLIFFLKLFLRQQIELQI